MRRQTPLHRCRHSQGNEIYEWGMFAPKPIWGRRPAINKSLWCASRILLHNHNASFDRILTSKYVGNRTQNQFRVYLNWRRKRFPKHRRFLNILDQTYRTQAVAIMLLQSVKYLHRCSSPALPPPRSWKHQVRHPFHTLLLGSQQHLLFRPVRWPTKEHFPGWDMLNTVCRFLRQRVIHSYLSVPSVAYVTGELPSWCSEPTKVNGCLYHRIVRCTLCRICLLIIHSCSSIVQFTVLYLERRS